MWCLSCVRHELMANGDLQAMSELRAGHASQTSVKMSELAHQLADTRAEKEQLKDKLNACIEEISAKLAAEKRRSASLKVVSCDVPAKKTHICSSVFTSYLVATSLCGLANPGQGW